MEPPSERASKLYALDELGRDHYFFYMDENVKATRYAGFWARWTAEMVDSTILTVVSSVLELMLLGLWYWIGVFWKGAPQGGFFDSFDAFSFQVLNVILYVACALPYYIYLHFKDGTTFGKKMLRIYVVNYADHAPLTMKQSVIRCLAYVLSYLPMTAGFLMAAFHPEKRGLHDLIAGTVSIYRPKAMENSV